MSNTKTANEKPISNPSTGNNKRGIDVLRDPSISKSTGFTGAERQAFGLVGLVPDLTESIETHPTDMVAFIRQHVYKPQYE